MSRRTGLLGLAAVLAGCTVGPNYQRPPALSASAPPTALISAQEAGYNPDAALPPRWWQLYDDEVLNRLEEKALVHNTDLRVALANLDRARYALRSVQLQRSPRTTLSVDPTYGQASADAVGSPAALTPGPVYDAMENISYDLDLFGRLKRSIEASKADTDTAQAALDLARVNVAASTAEAYSSVCAAGLEIVVTDRSIKLASRTLEVTQRRYDAGIAGINDVVRARTLLRQTAAMRPALVTQQRTALFTLATLTGDRPEALPASVANCVMPPVVRQPLPVGNGATLLARRPDVREAERKLASAVATIGVSTAALYPSISIGGSFGTTATNLSDISRSRGFVWNVGPLITWNVPNLSIARTQVAESGAAAQAALAQFDGSVLTALRETESALTTLARQLDTNRELAAARDDAATASSNTEKLYAGGIGDFLDTLDAERTLFQADSSLASAIAQVSQNQIALFMALGGGWQEAPAVAATSLQPVTARTP